MDGPDCLAKWMTKGKFGDGHRMDIDWKATEQLMESLSLNQHNWFIKHNYGLCGVGVIMRDTYKKRLAVTCPHCPTDENAAYL